MKGVEVIGKALHSAGASAVFAMFGGSNVAWLGLVAATGELDVVKCRHEESAVNGAMGYGRVVGDIGFCTVTRGVGFANTVNALLCAVRVHGPVVMIVGESPSPNPHTTQNVEQEKICALIGAGFRHAGTAAQALEVIYDAVAECRSTGVPQVVSLGEEVLDTEAEFRPARVPAAADPQQAAPAEAVQEAVRILAESSRPLIIAGQGAVLSSCHDDLVALAQEAGADVATSLIANRFFNGFPGELGVSGGWSTPLSFDHLLGHDVIVAVGAALNIHTVADGRITDGATVIRCDVRDLESPVLGAAKDLTLVGDAGATVRQLLDAWRQQGLTPRPGRSATTRAEQLASVLEVELPSDPARGLDLRRALHVLDGRLPEDRVVVTDSGSTVSLTSALVGARDAASWIAGRGYGCVGQGLGIAVGAAAGARDRRVVLFCGDGGFMMAISALDTARLHSLGNLMVVILDDEQYGSEVKYLQRQSLPPDIIRQPIPDVTALAPVYGGRGVVIKDEKALEDLDLSDGLLIVDLRIDPEVSYRRALAAAVAV